MKAYKGFDRLKDGTLWCRYFKYEVGKTYKLKGDPMLCEYGFHACHEPYQCWQFYPNNGKNVYYEVECGGTIIESGACDGKFVCTEITLVKEIPAPENKFDDCWCFRNGYAKAALNDKYNHINTEGKYISEQWFDDCFDFRDGHAIVQSNGKWNFINTDGKLISEQWFDDCFDFRDGHAEVKMNGEWFKLDKNGKIMEE